MGIGGFEGEERVWYMNFETLHPLHKIGLESIFNALLIRILRNVLTSLRTKEAVKTYSKTPKASARKNRGKEREYKIVKI